MAPSFPDIVEHFKYGSIGAEEGDGHPLLDLARAAGRLRATHCRHGPASGYERIGFIDEGAAARPADRHVVPAGQRRPRRAQLRHLPCRHVARDAGGARRVDRRHAGESDGPAGLCAVPDGLRRRARAFDTGTLIDAIRQGEPATSAGSQRLAYRLFVVRATRNGILERAKRERLVRRPPAAGTRPRRHLQPLQAPAGPADGRHGRHGRPAVALEPAGAAGPVAALGRQQRLGRRAQQERRDRRGRHAEVARPAVDGPHRRVDRCASQPPRIRPTAIDPVRALEGAAVYAAGMRGVSPFGGARVGQVTPLADSRHRPRAARLVHAGPRGGDEHDRRGPARGSSRASARPTATPTCRSTASGCARPTCTTARCPTCARCCFPEERPRVFYRAYDVYDWERVGFVTPVRRGRARRRPFDTALRGNGNGGHLYGADLPAETKLAIIEYMKTL